MQRSQTRIKVFITAIAIITVAIILYFLISGISRRGETKLNIQTIPSSAEVKIDGKAARKSTYLSPGEHTLSISASGFETQEDTVNISNGATTRYYPLTPVSESAKAWAKKNQTLYLQLEGKVAEQNRIEGETFAKNNPITNVLPYRGALYDIEYRQKANGQIVILIIADSAENRAFALRKIENMGYQPTDFEIEFPVNFSNVFDNLEEYEEG